MVKSWQAKSIGYIKSKLITLILNSVSWYMNKPKDMAFSNLKSLISGLPMLFIIFSSAEPARLWFSFMILIHIGQTRKYPLRGCILGVLTHTTALDQLGEVMELWPCGFEIEYTHLGFASAGAVWLGIWNSDHVVLKSSIHTLALPWH